jgi:MFS family permease
VADFYAARLPPQTQVALQAWWKTKPLTSKDAPSTPFAMNEYNQPELDEANKQDKNAGEHSALGMKAGKNSDTYVLLTVMFASVLFFGGIGGTFSSRWLRRTMMYISLVLFLVTFMALCLMPVGWD